jgi:hypothetical protein
MACLMDFYRLATLLRDRDRAGISKLRPRATSQVSILLPRPLRCAQEVKETRAETAP